MGALEGAHPNTYAGVVVQTIQDRRLTANQALAWPLSGGGRQWITKIEQRIEAAPAHTRDQRLVAWLDAAEAAGANLDQALVGQYDRGSGMSRSALLLMKLQAWETLRWYQQRGLETHLGGMGKTGTNPPTLFELALFHGQPDAAEQLMDERDMPYGDLLWRRLWHKSCAGRITACARVLEKKGPPPADLLNGLPGADVNQSNIGAVIKTANILAARGLPLPQTVDKITPLGRAIGHTRSPASVEVIRWLLDHGADPSETTLAGKTGSTWSGNALAVAIWHWEQTLPTSQMRDVYRDSVALLAKACPAKIREETLSPQRVTQIEHTLRGRERPVFRHALKSGWTADEDIAWLRRTALGGSIDPNRESVPVRRPGL